MRRVLQGVAVAAMVTLLTLAGGQAAQAAPYWQVVQTNATWHCLGSVKHTANPLVRFQGCTIVNGRSMQTALVVYNGVDDPIRIYGETLDTNYGSSFCYESTLSPTYRRGCLGGTRTMANCRTYSAIVTLFVNGISNTTPAPGWRTPCPT